MLRERIDNWRQPRISAQLPNGDNTTDAN
jgi:hypothetical protein